jgi:predicted O-methyltransferase YrrM
VNSNRKRLKQQYPDCWHWICLATKFSGELTEEEANSLFQLARLRTPAIHPVIVELGAWQGKTTLLLAAGLRGKTRPRLFSFPGAVAPLGRNLERCGLGHIVHTTGSENWQDGIDILFLNATGTPDTLQGQLSLWSPFVRPGGLVVLHGVSSASVLSAPEYSEARQVNNLTWAVKQWVEPPGVAEEIASAKIQDYVRRAARQLAENRHAVQALRRSWSWRLTAPLRWGVEALHAFAGLVRSLGRRSLQARITGLFQWYLYRGQVRASGLLDERYYRDSHAGVAWARSNPLFHFFVCGAVDGNKPNELFDVEYYLGRYPDVARSGVNPLVHYLKNGAYEGRDPHPHFDSSFYLEQNPDVREARLNPLAHYLAPGIAEGRDPNPWFDTSEYLEQNPDVVDFALNPVVHQQWANRQLCSR